MQTFSRYFQLLAISVLFSENKTNMTIHIQTKKSLYKGIKQVFMDDINRMPRKYFMIENAFSYFFDKNKDSITLFNEKIRM